MGEVQNDVGSSQDVAIMKEALSKLALRVESLESGALRSGKELKAREIYVCL